MEPVDNFTSQTCHDNQDNCLSSPTHICENEFQFIYKWTRIVHCICILERNKHIRANKLSKITNSLILPIMAEDIH